MGCQEVVAIVPDLIERFSDPDANQSAPWNTVVCTAGVRPYQSDVVAAIHIAIVVKRTLGTERSGGRRKQTSSKNEDRAYFAGTRRFNSSNQSNPGPPSRAQRGEVALKSGNDRRSASEWLKFVNPAISHQ